MVAIVPASLAVSVEASDGTVAAVLAGQSAIVSQFGETDAIAFDAEVTVTFHESIAGSSIAIGIPISGELRYRAVGEKWVRISTLDSELFPGMNTRTSFDGTCYAYEMVDEGVRSVSFKGDERSTGMMLPNPVLEIGRFIAPTEDLNSELLFRKIREEAQNFVPAEKIASTDQSTFAIEYQAEEVFGAPSRLRYLFNENGKLVEIERVLSDGRLAATLKCDEYRNFTTDSGAVMAWPTRFQIIEFNTRASRIAASMEIQLFRLTVSRSEIENEDFHPTWNGGSQTWLDDFGVFLR